MAKLTSTYVWLPLSFFLLSLASGGQNIRHFLQLMHYQKNLQGTFFAIDSVIDVKNGFAGFNNVYKDGEREMIMLAKTFQSKKSTLVVSAIYSGDEQCSFYHTLFYKYDKQRDSLIRIPDSEVLPDLPFGLF